MGRELIQFSPLINRNDLHRKIGYGRLCCNEESRGMASLNRGFDIGPLGNGCFISRISVVQLGLRCATQSSGKISRLRLLRRRGFHSTWTRPGIRKGRGGGEWNYKCAMMSREYIFTPRYNFAWSAAGRKIAFAPILQPDGSMNHTSARESHFRRITTMNY